MARAAVPRAVDGTHRRDVTRLSPGTRPTLVHAGATAGDRSFRNRPTSSRLNGKRLVCQFHFTVNGKGHFARAHHADPAERYSPTRIRLVAASGIRRQSLSVVCAEYSACQ
jgi:hypothetical protein